MAVAHCVSRAAVIGSLAILGISSGTTTNNVVERLSQRRGLRVERFRVIVAAEHAGSASGETLGGIDIALHFDERDRALGEPSVRMKDCPMSYHNGSIWPHNNALIALGLARYNLKGAVDRIFRGLFDAAVHMDLRRLPELFCDSSGDAGAGRRSIPSPARRRPGRPPPRSRSSRLRLVWNSIRVNAKLDCATRVCRPFSTR